MGKCFVIADIVGKYRVGPSSEVFLFLTTSVFAEADKWRFDSH